ncbi:hypothetical protein [Halobellus captivus]|uniref:hypothetical protein n=1 Tax=Halobellus captivus TaxID=2592614 RepID=UPI0011A2F226|nr:hypothetical protein [Halobellus captivus]
MSNRYIEINKADLTLALAWTAAVLAYWSWKEASQARHAASRNLDPITVSGGEVESDVEEAQTDE